MRSSKTKQPKVESPFLKTRNVDDKLSLEVIELRKENEQKSHRIKELEQLLEERTSQLEQIIVQQEKEIQEVSKELQLIKNQAKKELNSRSRSKLSQENIDELLSEFRSSQANFDKLSSDLINKYQSNNQISQRTKKDPHGFDQLSPSSKGNISQDYFYSAQKQEKKLSKIEKMNTTPQNRKKDNSRLSEKSPQIQTLLRELNQQESQVEKKMKVNLKHQLIQKQSIKSDSKIAQDMKRNLQEQLELIQQQKKIQQAKLKNY